MLSNLLFQLLKDTISSNSSV